MPLSFDLTNLLDPPRQEIRARGRLVGVRRAHLPDAAPTIPLPRRRRRRNLRCDSGRRTPLPDPHAARLGLDPAETPDAGAGAPAGIRPDGRAGDYESALLPRRELGRCHGEAGAAAVQADGQE